MHLKKISYSKLISAQSKLETDFKWLATKVFKKHDRPTGNKAAAVMFFRWQRKKIGKKLF